MSVLIRPLSPMFSLNKTSPSSLREIRVRRGQNSRLKSNYVHNFLASSAYDLHFSSVRFSMKKSAMMLARISVTAEDPKLTWDTFMLMQTEI